MFYPVAIGKQDIVRDGLVLWLDANDKSSYPGSGTTWNDLTPGDNNGTLTNGPTFDSANGGSIVFDGVDDYVTLPNENFQFANQGVTYDIWVNIPDNPDLYYFWIINSDGSNSGRPRINLAKARSGYINGKVYMQLVTVDNLRIQADDTLKGSDYPSLGVQHFVGVIEYNGSVYQAKLYRDGNLVSTNTVNDIITSYSIPTTTTMSLGSSTTSGFMDGPIYNVKIYNRALTSDEVLQNYNATKDRFGL